MKTLTMVYDPYSKYFIVPKERGAKLCRNSLDNLFILPPRRRIITLVGLKKPTPDTVKIRKPATGCEGTLIVDGTIYWLYMSMYNFLIQWIKEGYDNIRVEYLS